MAENNLAIGDYIAVLNNLDGDETLDYNVSDPEWPSLMTPMPVAQTSESLSPPTSSRQQFLVTSKQPLAIPENRQSLSALKVCQNQKNENQRQATKMVVARHFDLSVETTIKLVSDMPKFSNYGNQVDFGSTNFQNYSPYTPACSSPYQPYSRSQSVYDKSYTEAQNAFTPDSGIGTPSSNGSFAEQKVCSGYNNGWESDGFENKLTPKPVKRRRRTTMLNMLAAKSKKLTTTGMKPLKSDTSTDSVNQNWNDTIASSQQNDSGISTSFIAEREDSTADSEINVVSDSIAEKESSSRTTTTAKRKRRAKIVRPSEEEFQEKVAAKLVGRLVIKQSIPKYRITYNELLRRVGSPELFNVSALITLFRIKKDAESSTRILNILKDAGYDLKKGRRMNRNITRFSSFAEEEAIETGHDVEKIVKTYTPVDAASRVFIQRQKPYQSPDTLLKKLQSLRIFYCAAKLIVDSDSTPLAFHRPPANAIPLNPVLQEKLGYLTWVSHGFSKTAYTGLIDSLNCSAGAIINQASCNVNLVTDGQCSANNFGQQSDVSSYNPMQRQQRQQQQQQPQQQQTVPVNRWQALNDVRNTETGYSEQSNCQVLDNNFAAPESCALLFESSNPTQQYSSTCTPYAGNEQWPRANCFLSNNVHRQASLYY